MLWLASACALALTMGALHHFTAASPLAARATLALGFLLIAAWLGGDLAARRRLPRVTGFLFIGLCVGPAWLNLVRPDELAAVQFLADAGIALFALVAGAELALAARLPDRLGLARIAVAAIVLPFAAITFVMLSVSPWFPLTLHESFANAAGVALALGAVAAVSSPVMSVVSIDDLAAPGSFARALIGVSVAQDAALLVVLAFALLVAHPFASAGNLNLDAAQTALGRFAGSLAAGGVLGLLIAQARVLAGTRWRAWGATPVVLAIGCLLALLQHTLGVEPLLVALTTGFTLQQRGVDVGAALGGALRGGGVGAEGAASPVVALSFGIAGAGLRLDMLADLWPWVVLLIAVRATVLRYGIRWAVQGSGVTPALAREGWLGLISQSGTALGLAPLVRRAFPALGVSLEALILATVAIHEVAGPFCFRLALTRAGTIKEAAHAGEGTDAAVGMVGALGGGVR